MKKQTIQKIKTKTDQKQKHKKALKTNTKNIIIASTIITILAITSTTIIAHKYYTGQDTEDTIKTFITQGKIILLGNKQHTKLQGKTIGRAYIGGNLAWIQTGKNPKQTKSICKHEFGHMLGIKGGETWQHQWLENNSHKLENEMCNKFITQAKEEIQKHDN